LAQCSSSRGAHYEGGAKSRGESNAEHRERRPKPIQGVGGAQNRVINRERTCTSKLAVLWLKVLSRAKKRSRGTEKKKRGSSKGTRYKRAMGIRFRSRFGDQDVVRGGRGGEKKGRSRRKEEGREAGKGSTGTGTKAEEGSHSSLLGGCALSEGGNHLQKEIKEKT